jgi:hypothetical protein
MINPAHLAVPAHIIVVGRVRGRLRMVETALIQARPRATRLFDHGVAKLRPERVRHADRRTVITLPCAVPRSGRGASW